MGEHFTTARGRGYNVGEVDEFVARIDRVRQGAERIGPHDVRQVVFTIMRGGYAMDEVDAWLDEVEAAVDDGTTAETAGDGTAAEASAGEGTTSERTPDQPEFPQASRWQRGYVVEEVDALLARVHAGGVSADEVRDSIFREVRGGYAEDAVDAWLDLVERHLREG